MNGPLDVKIQSFHPSMQAEVYKLISEGLAEHFGSNDPSQNADLHDIATAYQDAVFLVAIADENIIGTGGLIREADGVGRIVRMSVAHSMRRQGIGTLILDSLKAAALENGYHYLVLETTASWNDAIAFYSAQGFEFLGIDEGRNEANFKLLLFF